MELGSHIPTIGQTQHPPFLLPSSILSLHTYSVAKTGGLGSGPSDCWAAVGRALQKVAAAVAAGRESVGGGGGSSNQICQVHALLGKVQESGQKGFYEHVSKCTKEHLKAAKREFMRDLLGMAMDDTMPF